MSDSELRGVSEAVMVPTGEAEWAALGRQRGARTVEHRGRYWTEMPRGFFRPVHWMARLSESEATRPARTCWGYRASLREDAQASANGTMPVHLLSNVAEYDMQYLHRKRRNHLRKCYKGVQLVEVTGPSLLEEQGYRVVRSSRKRTAYASVGSNEEYVSGTRKLMATGSRLFLGGLVSGELGGYLVGYAVEKTAYIESVLIATEFLSSDVGTGLVFEFVQACRRSGQIQEVVYGLHSAEDSDLQVYKEGMGFPVTPFPTRVRVNRLIAPLIRWMRPHVYYRLTGEA